MGSIRPILNVAITQRTKREESAEALYWKGVFRSGSGQILKEFSPINHVDVRDSDNQLLICSGSRLALYASVGKTVSSSGATELDVGSDVAVIGNAIKNYSAPKVRQLYHGVFRRPDSRLLVAGSDDGRAFVWDTTANRPLRVLGDGSSKDRHEAAVRFVTFCQGGREVVTASDDGNVRLWDLAVGNALSTLGRHQDYVRCGTDCSESGLIATGGYDHIIRLWDTRQSSPCHEWKVSAAVESVACNRSLLFAAAGQTLYSYDMVAGRSIVEARQVHSKQVTAVATHGRSVISVGLDGQLRVWDLHLRPLHRTSFAPSQLISIGLGAKSIGVGSSDGQVHIKSLDCTPDQTSTTTINATDRKSASALAKSTLRNKRLRRGVNPELSGIETFGNGSTVVVRRDADRPTKNLKSYEKLLLEYRYSDALDAVMTQSKSNPVVVVSMLQELIRRHALHVALAGRSNAQLRRIVHFVCRHVTDARLSRPLLDTSMTLTELYTANVATDSTLSAAFKRLASLVNNEVNRLQQLAALQGQIHLLLSNMVTT